MFEVVQKSCPTELHWPNLYQRRVISRDELSVRRIIRLIISIKRRRILLHNSSRYFLRGLHDGCFGELRSRVAKIQKPVPLMWKLRQKTVCFLSRYKFLRRIIRLRRTVRLLARLEDVLTDESASDEFCSIIRLSTEFILGTDYPSETNNPSLV